MTKFKEIELETLHKLLNYDTETGKLFWKERPLSMFTCQRLANRWNTRYAGKPALAFIAPDGYAVGTVSGKLYRAHRICWALHYDEWPSDQIDHINHSKADNRITNLRIASQPENNKNRTICAKNKYGMSGVTWHKNRYYASIRSDGKMIHLGCFTEIDRAYAARKAGELKYGFHKNHGNQQTINARSY